MAVCAMIGQSVINVKSGGRVVIDLTHPHVCDGSAVAGIDTAVLRFPKRGVATAVVGLNAASATLLERLAVHDKPGAVGMAPGH